MAATAKSVESSSDYSVNRETQDRPDAITDLAQLEQAKAAYNQAKQVSLLRKGQYIWDVAHAFSDLISLRPQRNC